jgi:hypothetical protein
MKKSLLGLSIFSIVMLSLSACTINMVTGDGRLTTQTRNVSGFNSILFAGLGDVSITQGATEGLTIEAEDNIMPLIVTTVQNGQLYIGFERNNWQDIVRPTKTIKFTLSVKNLNSVEISGVGSLSADSLNAEDLTVKVGGAGGVTIKNLEATSLTAIMSGAGNLDISGKVSSLNATLSGVGNFSCGDLQASTAKVNVTGAGGAKVWASDSLSVSITGAGSVSYYGSPAISKNITGLGVLNELGSK